jgi:hypothetical protein
VRRPWDPLEHPCPIGEREGERERERERERENKGEKLMVDPRVREQKMIIEEYEGP